ncbi:MAG: Na+/H+ antiporter NhaA [Gammaproteobacteria bacterium RIFCSPHIGHO2_12_FULL_45_9]|nr:MAG: Na+/H+ antiporter NhaA [Gammaproteobacteria bacterium RIFCSPHIGHO2_12_FULL_45_9]
MRALRSFLKTETSGGWLLLLTTVVALVWVNSPWHRVYEAILWSPLTVRWKGLLTGDGTLLTFINHFGMSFFFLLVGLEIKREFCFGELRTTASRILPLVAACGGMVVPAVLYSMCNLHSVGLRGWGIPMATDIAFALGVLSLLGTRVPVALKVFLMTLAIFDDMGAMVVIVLGYGHALQWGWIGAAVLCTLGLWGCHQYRVMRSSVYMLLGIVLYVCLAHSGIHATLSGLIVALLLPLQDASGIVTRFRRWEDRLHPFVAFGIVPLFAFLNAGVRWVGISPDLIWNSVSSGILLGLCVGKWLGIVGAVWMGVKMRWVRLPDTLSWRMLNGVGILGGVGFTMSLFIGTLAFGDNAAGLSVSARMGVLMSSGICALVGYIFLRWWGLSRRI